MLSNRRFKVTIKTDPKRYKNNVSITTLRRSPKRLFFRPVKYVSETSQNCRLVTLLIRRLIDVISTQNYNVFFNAAYRRHTNVLTW